jgi:chromosome segregation ATPase
VAALNSEKSAAEKMLAEIKGQHEEAQKQLKATLADLDRATNLAKLEHEIRDGRKTLEGLRADIAGAEAVRTKVVQEYKEAETKRDAAVSEIAGLRQERVDANADLDRIRKLFNSIELRRSAA